MRLLYLEDNAQDAELVRRALVRSMPEFELVVVHTLAAAHGLLAETVEFDLALLDVRLPDGSGLELLYAIRAHQLPIATVILTGTGDEETVIRALKSQADDYLVKGSDYLDRLPDTLHQALARFRRAGQLRSVPMNVLYVEHNEDDADLTRIHLARHAPHIRLHRVPGAEAALRQLGDPTQPQYQVLLLDYRLAGMNALELIKALRQRHLHQPIVLVTGRGSEETAAAALRLGVSDYLIKNPGYLERLPAVLEHAYAHAELISERARLQYLSTYDELTGLLNRVEFRGRAEQQLIRARRHDERCALLLIDLDDFKAVNDTFGHAIGDQLLRGFAERLRGLLREEDLCCRFGGDEFLAFFAGTDQAGAGRAAERINEARTEGIRVRDQELVASATIGIGIFPDNSLDIDSLVQNADTAMHKAKSGGRGHYRFFDPAMNEEVAARFRTEEALRRALERQEFFLVYQPQLDLRDGQTGGAEALLRWRHPDLGLLLPDRFIPVAEASGQIIPIGEWVLREACRQLRAWLDQGLPPVRLAINLSARQFRYPALEEAIVRALADNALAPGSVEIELTETAVADDPAHARQVLERLKAAGLSIAIDDFGTGFSSLAHLRSFPLDRLKVARGFVAAIGEGEDGAVISSAIVGLAGRLGLQAVAEGVETPEQLDFLRAQGCPLAQGYLISHPLQADAFAAWLSGISEPH